MLKEDIKICLQENGDFLDQIAEIAYDTFEQKMLHILLLNKTREQGIRILRQSLNLICPTYCALKNGNVVGFVGIEENRHNKFLNIGIKHLISEFGILGGTLRRIRLLVFNLPHAKNNELYIYAIGVLPLERGKGTGEKLLMQVETYAKEKNKSSVSLEVVNTNNGAIKLYKRLGFVETKYLNYGTFTRKAGFTGSYRMQKCTN